MPFPLILQCTSLQESDDHRDSSCRVVDKHVAHEVDTTGLKRDEDLLQGLGLPLGELVPVPQHAHSRPDLLVGGPQQLEDVQKLLDLAVAWEECRLHHSTTSIT